MNCQTNDKCLSGDDIKHYTKFANSYYDKFREIRFGIKSCARLRKDWLDDLRHEIAQYRKNDDADALSTITVNAKLVPSLSILPNPMKPCSVIVKYTNGSLSENIIEINSGGCVTNVNVEPVISVTGISYKYLQDCASPSNEWIINHNMNLVPNVWVEDCNGVDLVPVVEVINNNSVKLKFSQPVSGEAFLS
jgi:hypothetical protein